MGRHRQQAVAMTFSLGSAAQRLCGLGQLVTELASPFLSFPFRLL